MPPAPAPSLPDRSVLWRYNLYKTGTDKLVSWLLETAASVGYGDPKNLPKPPVPVKKLLKCADAIVSRMPHIPGSMVDITDDVIRGRQVYADLFSSSRVEGQKPDASDISHQHFIDALHTIHKQLKEARKKQKVGKEGNKGFGIPLATPPATPLSPVKNSQFTLPRERSLQSLFKHLEVDEPTDRPFSTPEKQKKPAAAPIPVKHSIAIDPVAESRFALLCFLEDMADIHSFIRDLWEDVVAGKVSVGTATTTTENAFGCIRRAQYVLIDTFHELGTKDTTGLFLSLVQVATSMRDHSKTTLIIGDKLQWDPHKTHLLCIDATLIATEAINECRQYRAAKKKRGGCVYTMSDMATVLSDAHPFAKALFKVLPDLLLLDNADNEYANALCAQDGSHDMQISTAMMTQSYCDIYDIVGPEIDSLLPTGMDATLKRLERDIANRDDILGTILCPPSFGQPETLLSTLLREKKVLAQLQSPSLDRTKSRTAAEARVAKALPLGASEQFKFSRWLVTQTSAPMANDGWVTLGLAYLYRACLYYGLLSEKWPDMEWLIALQSQTRSYVIEVAEYADEFAWSRHYKMAFGVPPEYIKKVNMSKITEGMRKVESQLLWPKLGEALAQAEDVLGYERGDMMEEVLHQIADRVYTGKKGRRGEAKYTSLELLTAFKQATIHDEMELNFSYTSFWANNAKLLHTMSKFLRKRIPEMLQEIAVGADFEIVHPLLKEAALSVSLGEPLMGTQIALAAKMMEKHIKAEGDKFTSEARALSSNGAGQGTWIGK